MGFATKKFIALGQNRPEIEENYDIDNLYMLVRLTVHF